MGTLKQAVDRVTAAKTAIGAAITAKGGTVAAGDGLEDFATDIATITNQYSAADEGKVVSNGALVAQTAYPSEITANNTYDTTNYNSITVNVPSGATLYTPTISADNSGMQTANIHFFINNNVLFVYGDYVSTTTTYGTNHSSNIQFGNTLKNFGVSSETNKTFKIFSITGSYSSQIGYATSSVNENSTQVSLRIYTGSSSFSGYIIGFCDFN